MLRRLLHETMGSLKIQAGELIIAVQLPSEV